MAQLQGIEVVAREQRQDAIKAGDLVEGEGEGDEFGGGAEGDEVEEGLYGIMLVGHVVS